MERAEASYAAFDEQLEKEEDDALSNMHANCAALKAAAEAYDKAEKGKRKSKSGRKSPAKAAAARVRGNRVELHFQLPADHVDRASSKFRSNT